MHNNTNQATFSVWYRDPDTNDYITYKEGLTESEADKEVLRNAENGFLSGKREERNETKEPA